MPTAETSRAAYVAVTRHRDDLQIFVAREAVKDFSDSEMGIGRRDGLIEHEKEDKRSADQIIQQLGRSLGRQDEPRNALDVLGIKPNNVQPPEKKAEMSKQQAGGQPQQQKTARPSFVAARFKDMARQPGAAASQQKQEALRADVIPAAAPVRTPLQAPALPPAAPKKRRIEHDHDFGPSL